MAVKIVCPTCPMCGELPAMVMAAGQQAFCDAEDCPAFCWDMTISKAANRRDTNVVDLDALMGDGDTPT